MPSQQKTYVILCCRCKPDFKKNRTSCHEKCLQWCVCWMIQVPYLSGPSNKTRKCTFLWNPLPQRDCCDPHQAVSLVYFCSSEPCLTFCAYWELHVGCLGSLVKAPRGWGHKEGGGKTENVEPSFLVKKVADFLSVSYSDKKHVCVHYKWPQPKISGDYWRFCIALLTKPLLKPGLASSKLLNRRPFRGDDLERQDVDSECGRHRSGTFSG